MQILTEPTAILEQILPDGKKGHVLRFDLDFSVDNQFNVKLRYLSVSGQQIPFIARSLQINNTDNTNPISVIYDEVLQYPHLAIAGQISVAQLPFIQKVPDIQFTGTIQSGLTVPIFISDFAMSPASYGTAGSAVTVTNTVPVNINNAPILVNQQNPKFSYPFSGIVAAGDTELLAADHTIYEIRLWVSGDAIQSAAGDNLIEIVDGSSPIAVAKPYIPAASLGQIDRQILAWTLAGGYVMQNGSLSISLANALTGGNVYGYLGYT